MIPLLLACTIIVSTLATATLLFLRKLTRKERAWYWVSVDTAKAAESLETFSQAAFRASIAFQAFSVEVEGLDNPALKHWAKTQP